MNSLLPTAAVIAALLAAAGPAVVAPPAGDGSGTGVSGRKVVELLAGHVYELTHDGKLGGSGLGFLLREAAGAQFVLLGEPHNTDQVNRLTAMLFRALHDQHGFRHLVAEQGGLILDRFARSGTRGRVDAIRSTARDHPEALHFSTDAELELLAEIGRISDAEHPLWGVDRVHDALLAIESLLEVTESGEQRLRLESALRQLRESAGPRHIGDQGESFDRLLSGLEYRAGTRAARVLEATRVSREDFLAYRTEHEPGDPWGFLANLRREELMKTRFLEHYRDASAGGGVQPRALAKLGHWHVERGHGSGSVPTFGSFLVDVARFNGMSAVSISIQPVNRPGRHWSITDYQEYAALTGAADPDRWILIDLRPLRGYVHSGALEVTQEVRRTVFGFDLLLLLGGTDRGRATWAESP